MIILIISLSGSCGSCCTLTADNCLCLECLTVCYKCYGVCLKCSYIVLECLRKFCCCSLKHGLLCYNEIISHILVLCKNCLNISLCFICKVSIKKLCKLLLSFLECLVVSSCYFLIDLMIFIITASEGVLTDSPLTVFELRSGKICLRLSHIIIVTKCRYKLSTTFCTYLCCCTGCCCTCCMACCLIYLVCCIVTLCTVLISLVTVLCTGGCLCFYLYDFYVIVFVNLNCKVCKLCLFCIKVLMTY